MTDPVCIFFLVRFVAMAVIAAAAKTAVGVRSVATVVTEDSAKPAALHARHDALGREKADRT